MTDANACGPVTGTLDVTDPPLPAATAAITSPVPCFGGTATVTISASSGIAPYTYTFNGITQVGDSIFAGIPAGTGYLWSVTDANGCGPVTGTLDITEPVEFTAVAVVLAPIPCVGGTATVIILETGGTAPYTYTFNGVTQVGNNIFTGIPAGTGYIWSVNDAGGCGPVSSTLDVTEPPIPSASASVTVPVLCAGDLATVTIVAANGVAPYTYIFNGITQVGNGVFTGIAAGAGYAWSVFDNNGCGPVTGLLDVDGPGVLLGSVSVTSPIQCFGGTATITMIAMGGTAPFTFTFNGVTQVGDGVFTGIPAGSAYVWSINDANGCGPVPGILNVSEPGLFSANAIISAPVACAGGSATVTIQSNGGTAPNTYTFNGITQVGDSVFAGIPAGIGYIWSVNDANGCGPVSDTIDIIEPSPLTALISAQTVGLCIGDTTGFATVSVAGGTPSYTYLWNTTPAQTTPTAINLSPGTYIVTVTDTNGCTTTATAVITGALPITSNAGPDQMLCNADVTFLVGNSPVPGVGSWSFVSGPNIPGLFPPVGSVAVATGLIPSPVTYMFSYSIDNAGCVTSDTMSVINYNPPTPAYAGIDQKFCSASGVVVTNLSANTPVFGTGTWTQIAGPTTAVIMDPADPNTAVSGLTYGVYAFQWTITNGVCQADADVVNIYVSEPAVVDAGFNATICEGDTYELFSASATNYTSLLWTSTGTGTFQ